MEIVNRSAIVVKPRRPYLRWCQKDDAEGLAESVFELLRTEPHIYLLPEYTDPASLQEILDEFWPAIFEAMLESWVTDEAQWPKSRTHAMFAEWFDIQMCALVQDLDLDEPLELPSPPLDSQSASTSIRG